MKRELQALHSAAVEEPCLHTALNLSRCYANLCWSMNVGIYDAPLLERAMAERAGQSLMLQETVCSPTRDTLHVISEAYLTGGHTRLMEKLASMHDTAPDLLVTRTADAQVIEKVSRYFSEVYVVESTVDDLRSIRYMVHTMSNYQRVVLSIHPDDITAVVSALLAKQISSTQVYFVNHADHCFSLGSAAADVYFELSSYGRRVDEHKDITGRKSFLGIPVNQPSCKVVRTDDAQHGADKLIFLSAGADIKYKPRGDQDMRPLIRRLLQDFPDATFLVIGPNVSLNPWWWGLRLQFPRRFQTMRHVPFDQYQQLVKCASFYVDSHPFPGGTAYAEQLLSGQKCIGLVSPFQGYSPAENMKSADVDAAIQQVKTYVLTPQTAEQVNLVNGYAHVKARYIECLYAGIVSPNLMDQFCPWSGDIRFMQSARGGRDADVDVRTFWQLMRLRRRLALAVFRRLGVMKKCKLIIKLCLYCTRHRSRSTGH
ncbi:group 1 glycosyl transferase [Pseudomonas cremoricolorata]|uniref:group 1 glycosyl transferase n=1 Tax=Pseudomonas cremoricolorata TaxID=157783 RepID=UPI000405BB99|nr:group 1 glycosyl transferase [Pseudomonas cremoricolorata]